MVVRGSWHVQNKIIMLISRQCSYDCDANRIHPPLTPPYKHQNGIIVCMYQKDSFGINLYIIYIVVGLSFYYLWHSKFLLFFIIKISVMDFFYKILCFYCF
jgi:hypothetical protein